MIGYDDPESIAIKVNYTLQRGLGGVMIWVRVDCLLAIVMTSWQMYLNVLRALTKMTAQDMHAIKANFRY